MNQKLSTALAAATFGVSVFCTAPASASVFVSALPSLPTLIGAVSAGSTYEVTAPGIADLCTSCNSGGPLEFFADGKPANTPTGGYAGFSPDGLDHDPTGSAYPGTGGYGQGGMGRLVGSLLGTFTPTPSGPADFFVIGLDTVFTASVNETLYAVINDTSYGDNVADSGYNVNLVLLRAGPTQPAGVPEPASLSLLGLGLLGMARSRRRSRRAR